MNRNEMIFSSIKVDHKEMKQLFARLEKTANRGAIARQRLYSKLRDAMIQHMEAEERAVYPRLKENSETASIAYASIEQHEIVKFLLRKIDAAPYDSAEWGAQVSALKEAFEDHLMEEEGRVFRLMRKSFSRGELQMMGTEFEQSKMGFLERIERFLSPETTPGRAA